MSLRQFGITSARQVGCVAWILCCMLRQAWFLKTKCCIFKVGKTPTYSGGSVFQCNQPHSCTGPSQRHSYRLHFDSHTSPHSPLPSVPRRMLRQKRHIWFSHLTDDRSVSLCAIIIFCCYLSCSCVQSSQERRRTAHSPGHSERRSHTHTLLGILDRIVQLDMLHKEKMILTSGLICCPIRNST